MRNTAFSWMRIPAPRKHKCHQRTSGAAPNVCRGPWAIRMGTGQRTRSILLATEFSTSVDRVTWLTPSPRLTGFNRSLSTTQWLTFNVAVTIPFFRQDPFNFNVEISVSCNLCRYQDPAGFRPRTIVKVSGSPASFIAPLRLQ